MSRNKNNYHRNHYNTSDEEDEVQNQKQGTVERSINELLQNALKEAANPGIGDEEPEVLEAPNNSSSSYCQKQAGEMKRIGQVNEEPEANKLRKDENKERNIRMLEEEKKLSELSFDQDYLIPGNNMRERARYIPLRLTYNERKNLRLVNASINVSDYTTTVDVAMRNKARRHHIQLQHIVAFLSGLIAATDFSKGQEVLADRNFANYEALIGSMLEIARRYKITNPEKMRSEYGKLVYLMQDAVSEAIKPLLGVSINVPIKTVYDLLETSNCLQLLDDARLATATQEILSDKSKNRGAIQSEIKRKEKAAEQIVRQYQSNLLSADAIRSCLYSISDNNSFLNSNKKPVDDCIELLKKYFSMENFDEQFSLSIDEGFFFLILFKKFICLIKNNNNKY
jgi:hypothetical protein